jgi:hypothetical protein
LFSARCERDCASLPAWSFAVSDAVVAQHLSEATQYRAFDRTLGV